MLGFLVSLALILTSCGQPAPQEPSEGTTVVGETTTPETGKPEEKALTQAAPEKETGPQYGGILSTTQVSDTLGYDQVSTNPYQTYTVYLTNEKLIVGDWAKGPAGTNEAEWRTSGLNFLHLSTGSVAESWEVPDQETIIYHIRKGIHFHNKPPTNGRELTADDVVYSLRRAFETPGSYCKITYPGDASPSSITATDKYTVVLKVPDWNLGALLIVTSGYLSIYPRDAGEQFGNFKDWRNSIGTGPFMLVDLIPGGQETYVRNPQYWGTDPVHPGNQLPYLDGIKRLIIPDTATSLAALRTGKIDVHSTNWRDAEDMKRTNPELKWDRFLSTVTFNISLRMDNPELPWHDIRVRHALAMGVNHEQIRDVHYGGNAQLLAFPIVPVKEIMPMYTPLEELPQNVRELYEYHPDKAKQLLAEAGYPQGFKASLILPNTTAAIDLLSVVKANWEEIGVDVTLEPREIAVWQMTVLGKRHTEMVYFYTGSSAPYKMNDWREGNPTNAAIVVDQKLEDAYNQVCLYYPLEEAKAQQIIKEINAYILEQAWTINLPQPYTTTFWQPWVGGYHGEASVGYYNVGNFAIWIWIDTAMKKQMGK